MSELSFFNRDKRTAKPQTFPISTLTEKHLASSVVNEGILSGFITSDAGSGFAVLHLQMILVLSLCYRTLLALGCHIAHVNPAAEEELKKVKLPKK